MKCRKVKELMGAYLFGDLSPAEMREVRDHALNCDECGEDLMSRGALIAAMDDSVPTLTDMERQEISWSVKGAVRATEEMGSRRRFMPAAAIACGIMLLAGLVLGKVITTYTPGSSEPVRQASEEKPRAIVTVTPKQVDSDSSNANDTAKSEPEYQVSPEVIERVGGAIRRSAGLATARTRDEARRQNVVAPEKSGAGSAVEESHQTKSDEKPAGEEPAMKLPNPTGLNDAQTDPVHSTE